jgi:hypothetical protein
MRSKRDSPGTLVVAVGEGRDWKSGIAELLTPCIAHPSTLPARDGLPHIRTEEVAASIKVVGHCLLKLGWGEGIAFRERADVAWRDWEGGTSKPEPDPPPRVMDNVGGGSGPPPRVMIMSGGGLQTPS